MWRTSKVIRRREVTPTAVVGGYFVWARRVDKDSGSADETCPGAGAILRKYARNKCSVAFAALYTSEFQFWRKVGGRRTYFSQFEYPSMKPFGDDLMSKQYQPTILANFCPLKPFNLACAATEARKAKKSRIIAVCNSDSTLNGINKLNASLE